MTYSFKTYEKSAILRGHLRMGGDNPAGERIDANSLYLERGGKPWRFPASLVYGKDCVMVLSQMKNDCYREV